LGPPLKPENKARRKKSKRKRKISKIIEVGIKSLVK
jgi:hypothetical protein